MVIISSVGSTTTEGKIKKKSLLHIGGDAILNLVVTLHMCRHGYCKKKKKKKKKPTVWL